MRVIIHIGTLKTGSTCLQHFLLKNHDKLLENKIFFPTIGLAEINYLRGGRFSGHNKLLLSVKNKEKALTDQLIHELEQTDCKNAILSSENFSIYPETVEPLATLLQNHKVQIVIYLRRQDTYLESLYKEFINGGWHKTTDDVHSFFYNNIGKYCTIERDYCQLIAPWAKAFGVENLLVRPFEAQQFYQHNLIRDFFHATGLPWSDNYDFPEKSARNASSDIQTNKILLDLNRVPLQQAYYQSALNQIFNETREKSNKGGGKQFFSSPELRHQVLRKYDESNQQVARTYLARDNGKLFYAPEPDPQEPFSQAKIKDIDLVSRMHATFLMQLGNELNDKLSKSNEEIERQKVKLERQRVELERQKATLEWNEAQRQRREKQVLKNEQAQRDSIKSLKQDLRITQEVNTRLSLAIWLVARKSIARRIKNLLRPEKPLINKSGLFDNQWYLIQYPEVAKCGMDPIEHYVKKGVELGYDPSSTFNTCLYIKNNRTVMMSGLNPLVSYILTKKPE